MVIRGASWKPKKWTIRSKMMAYCFGAAFSVCCRALIALFESDGKEYFDFELFLSLFCFMLCIVCWIADPNIIVCLHLCADAIVAFPLCSLMCTSAVVRGEVRFPKLQGTQR
jgi:hypothetical protein